MVAALVGPRNDHRGIAHRRVGDEVLGSVEDPLVAVADGGRLGAAGIGTGPGLGQTPRPDPLSRCQLGQELPPDLLRAEQKGVVRAQRVVGRDTEPDATVRGAELLDDGRVLDIAEPGAAVLLRDRHPEKAELSQFREQFAREMRLFVPPSGVRYDLVLGHLARHVADRLLIFGQLEIHTGLLPHVERA